jgi:hypothetical protein
MPKGAAVHLGNVFLTAALFAAVRIEDSDHEPYACVPGLLAEGLEEVNSVEPDTIEGRLRIKPERNDPSLRQGAIELPGFAREEVWNGAVRWHGTNQVALMPVSEEVVGAHPRFPLNRRPE